MKLHLILTYMFIFNILAIHSQTERVNGKIIKDFGQTFKVENPDIPTDTNATLKVIFDVSKSPEDNATINSYIVTAARFLNMHAEAGMKPEQLKVAMTIHGDAWKDMLNDDAYLEKFNTKNPNTKLIKQLTDAGVEIIMCGQTASYRGVTKENSNPDIKFALSAMTALIQYQNSGYRFIKF